MIKAILISAGILATLALSAQQSSSLGQTYYPDNKGIIYTRELTFDMKFLQTHGYSVGVNIGKLKTYYRTQYLNFEIGELKNPREYRQSFDFQAPSSNKVSRAFVFGKQNNLIVLRGGWGEKRYFSEKDKRKGLAIGISYEAGPTLGIIKPYYLELVRTNEPGSNDYFIRSEKYSEENADIFLDINRIFGSAGFAKGLDQISLLPGAHAKVALHFDWGAFDEFVKAMEAGLMIDFYLKKAPLMIETQLNPNVENSPLFLNLYVNFQLGKRW